MVYRALYSYRHRVRVVTLFPTFFLFFSVCRAILQKFFKGKSDAYKQLICVLQCVHFQVRAGLFDCQQILAKISFVIFDILIKKKNKSNVGQRGTGDLGLIDMFLINLNAEIVACMLSFRKSRTSKYFQIWSSPDLRGKMASF